MWHHNISSTTLPAIGANGRSTEGVQKRRRSTEKGEVQRKEKYRERRSTEKGEVQRKKKYRERKSTEREEVQREYSKLCMQTDTHKTIHICP
jgi:hypothetical protein